MNSAKSSPGLQPGRLSPADYLRQTNTVDEKILQFKEVQSFVTRVTGKCFKYCVNSFDGPKMTSDEKICLDNCIRRAQRTQNEANEVIPEVDNKFM
eukprot:403333785